MPPSYDDAGAVANVPGADWERRMRSRERALEQSEAELRRAEERAEAERSLTEKILERREAEAAEATAKCAEMSLKAEAAAECLRRGDREFREFDWDDSRRLVRRMDDIRDRVGVKYHEKKRT